MTDKQRIELLKEEIRYLYKAIDGYEIYVNCHIANLNKGNKILKRIEEIMFSGR